MRTARLLTAISSLAALSLGPAALANSIYERHVVFDNSRAIGWYLYSRGEVVAPSRIDLVNGKLPLETKLTHSPPNALRLSWTSNQGGNWEASIDTARIWGTQTGFEGDALSFWVYSDSDIDAASSPRIRLRDLDGAGNPAINLIGSLPKIPANRWTKIVLPFAGFTSAVRNTQRRDVRSAPVCADDDRPGARRWTAPLAW